MAIQWVKKQWQNRIELLQWQKASLLASRGNIAGALKIFESFDFSNGPKQIIFLQSANLKYKLGQNEEALALYNKSIESEVKWGKRKNRCNSKYIVEYAKLYANVQEQFILGKSDRSFGWTIPRIDKLKRINASTRLKKYFLPLP